MPKKLVVWTTDEIISLINSINESVPCTTIEYREGWEDAMKQMYKKINLELKERE